MCNCEEQDVAGLIVSNVNVVQEITRCSCVCVCVCVFVGAFQTILCEGVGVIINN